MRHAALVMVLLGLAAPAGAQTVVTGLVRDSTGKPLSEVDVSVEGARRQASTDASGRYALDSPAGNHVILFRLIGYEAQRIRIIGTRGDTVRLDAVLRKSSFQELPDVEVKERLAPVPGSIMAEFEERRRIGFGKFLDSTQLRRMEGRKMSDVLRGLGLRLIPYSENRGPLEWRAASSTAGTFNEGDHCWVSVFLDGMAIYRSGNRNMHPPDFSKDFNVWSLMAVEYYRSSATVPIEFGVGRDTDCGVLVLWTRKGK